MRSVAPQRVPVPFVREWFRHDRARVTALLGWCRRDLEFVQALADELCRCLGRVPIGMPHPDGMIEATEHKIADGLIEVASALPDNMSVVFDEDWPF